MSRDEMETSCTGPYCPLDRFRDSAVDVERFVHLDRAAKLMELLALHGPTAIRVLADRSGLTSVEARATLHAMAAEELVRVVGPGVSRDWRVARLTDRGADVLEGLRN